jgi:hypothetical protein
MRGGFERAATIEYRDRPWRVRALDTEQINRRAGAAREHVAAMHHQRLEGVLLRPPQTQRYLVVPPQEHAIEQERQDPRAAGNDMHVEGHNEMARASRGATVPHARMEPVVQSELRRLMCRPAIVGVPNPEVGRIPESACQKSLPACPGSSLDPQIRSWIWIANP